MKKARVVVAMSGGVDSSVAAALLVQAGYDVIGITMKTWGFMDVGGAPKHESGCCSLDAIYDAKNVAHMLGIPHYTVDFTQAFEDTVIKNFVDEYLKGRTPNPCVLCNRKIKWEELLGKADALDAEFISTGHYALIDFDEQNKRYKLKNAKDAKKDQSYVLWGLSQQSLKRTLFPLGAYDKTEVRLMAEKLGLKTASKPDSQEICFVTDDNYERFLRERLSDKESIQSGDVIYKGRIISRHRGIPFYTIGQRRGLNIAMGKPVYVIDIDPENNLIEIGEKEDLLKKNLIAGDVNYVSMEALQPGMNVIAKIRYADKGSDAKIIKCDNSMFEINFTDPKSAITPGQSVVLYDNEGYVLAGGLINDAN